MKGGAQTTTEQKVVSQIMEVRSAGLSKPTHVRVERIAEENMHVTCVGAQRALISAASAVGLNNLITPVLKLSFWEANLHRVRPPTEVNSLLDGLVNGVAIGRAPATEVLRSPNWPSAVLHRGQVSNIITNDLELGRLYGPFKDPPFKYYVTSPLGAIPKRGSNKIRVIHDLSFPPTRSVNDYIDPEEFSLSYSSIDDATCLINSFDSGTVYLAKLDLQDAYKHIFVRPADWHLLGFTWPDDKGNEAVYFSKVLNFGLRSSPALFDAYSGALLDLMVDAGAASSTVRYVDDFLTIADSAESCQYSLDIMLTTCSLAGFSVQPSKVTPPATSVVFLGINIDAAEGIISLPQDRLLEVKELVTSWMGAKVITKRQLLRLLGKLNFACRVIRQGRAFTGRLISASKSTKHLHYKIHLSKEAILDLRWWADCLQSHNGVSYIPRPWTEATTCHVFTDASDKAVAGKWDTHWFAAPFENNFISYSDESINWRELMAVILAANTWGEELRGRNVVFHIDNVATCYLIHKMYTPSLPLMALLRVWALIVDKFSLNFTAVYIPTKENVDADDLSRNKVDDFRYRNPGADREPTTLGSLPRFDQYL